MIVPHWMILSVCLLGFGAYLGWRRARNRRIGRELALTAELFTLPPPAGKTEDRGSKMEDEG